MNEEGEQRSQNEKHNTFSETDCLAIIKSAPGLEFWQDQNYPAISTNESSLTNLAEDKQKKVMDKIEGLNRYLSFPAYVDGFENHDQRREWRQEKIDEVKLAHGQDAADKLASFMHQNKVSTNAIAVALANIDYIAMITGKTIPEENKMQLMATRDILRADGGVRWDKMNAQDKLATAADFADNISNALHKMF
jgi:hypothetical protein